MLETGGSDIERLWDEIFRSKSTEVIQIQSHSMSDPPLSVIDFKNKMTWVWITLKIKIEMKNEFWTLGSIFKKYRMGPTNILCKVGSVVADDFHDFFKI